MRSCFFFGIKIKTLVYQGFWCVDYVFDYASRNFNKQSATSDHCLSFKCVYISSVVWIFEWPSLSDMVLGSKYITSFLSTVLFLGGGFLFYIKLKIKFSSGIKSKIIMIKYPKLLRASPHPCLASPAPSRALPTCVALLFSTWLS